MGQSPSTFGALNSVLVLFSKVEALGPSVGPAARRWFPDLEDVVNIVGFARGITLALLNVP